MRNRSADPAAVPSEGSQCITLFRVQFRHSYYNAADEQCPDFRVEPTPACARLVARLGIVFRDQGVGFSVAIPRARVGALMQLIANSFCAAPEGHGAWARLSFLLICTNPNFIGLTALPLDTCPTRENLYATNVQTHERGGALMLGDGQGLGAEALHTVTGPTLSLPMVGDGTITLYDLSGCPVRVVTGSTGTETTVSLASLPQGLYTITCVPPAAYAGPGSVLYVPARPISFGLIDLVLAQPAPGVGDPAAFPVAWVPPSSGTSAAMPSTIDLVLPFAARKTYWQYYVVSCDKQRRLGDDLSIQGYDMVFKSTAVVLANGDPALLFEADPPQGLPLRQRSPFRFTLSGHRRGADGSRSTISVDRLPAAPADPVWPASSGSFLDGNSEIYVYV